MRTRRLHTCKAAVKFQIQKQVEWGDKLYLVGNHKVFGRWEADNGVELRWGDGDVWTADIKLPDDASVEYKVVNVKGMGDPEWEKGDNRSLSVGSEPLDVQLTWGKTNNGAVAPGMDGSQHEDLSSYGQRSASASFDSLDTSTSDEQLPQNKWQGRDVQFMQENQHTKQRSGVWNTDGLDGAILELVKGDEKSARFAAV